MDFIVQEAKKREFTEEQLIEIEKIFDIKAGEVLSFTERIVNTGRSKIPEMNELVDRVIREMTHTFDTYRTISTIAKLKREEQP